MLQVRGLLVEEYGRICLQRVTARAHQRDYVTRVVCSVLSAHPHRLAKPMLLVAYAKGGPFVAPWSSEGEEDNRSSGDNLGQEVRSKTQILPFLSSSDLQNIGQRDLIQCDLIVLVDFSLTCSWRRPQIRLGKLLTSVSFYVFLCRRTRRRSRSICYGATT